MTRFGVLEEAYNWSTAGALCFRKEFVTITNKAGKNEGHHILAEVMRWNTGSRANWSWILACMYSMIFGNTERGTVTVSAVILQYVHVRFTEYHTSWNIKFLKTCCVNIARLKTLYCKRKGLLQMKEASGIRKTVCYVLTTRFLHTVKMFSLLASRVDFLKARMIMKWNIWFSKGWFLCSRGQKCLVNWCPIFSYLCILSITSACVSWRTWIE